MKPQDAYDELIDRSKRVSLLGSCAGVLGWDQETYMPPKGAEHRAEQLSLLAGMIHEQATDPRIGELLAACEGADLAANAESISAVNLRELRHAYDRAVKLPRAFVEELTHLTSLAQTVWVEAREKSAFSIFAPSLTRIVELKRQEAGYYGYEDDLYDALVDDYEPGATAKWLAGVLEPLRIELVALFERIQGAKRRPRGDILTREYPLGLQETFGRLAAAAVGYDFTAGRMDVSAHPFTTGLGPGDTRITTRYQAHRFNDAFFSIVHETGHALYEQGLPREHWGTPRGEAVSLGIHESQSRMWENMVARGHAFWQHFFPIAQQFFPAALGDVALDDFHFAVNDVSPGFIRVDADEVTYNLHIILRFEIELALLHGDLAVGDLPGAWNERFEKMFGLTPPDDAQGCLQDIHWSHGSFGYFPTYALGNLNAAQFFAAAGAALGDLDEQLARGEFAGLLGWLRENIHAVGMTWRAPDLCRRVTGNPLDHAPLMAHLREKYEPLYGL